MRETHGLDESVYFYLLTLRTMAPFTLVICVLGLLQDFHKSTARSCQYCYRRWYRSGSYSASWHISRILSMQIHRSVFQVKELFDHDWLQKEWRLCKEKSSIVIKSLFLRIWLNAKIRTTQYAGVCTSACVLACLLDCMYVYVRTYMNILVNDWSNTVIAKY